MLNANIGNNNNSNGDNREVAESVGVKTARRRNKRRVEGSPCGACKLLKRKCTEGCIFAPYFSSDEGEACFAAVHKVYGASHVAKMLSVIPENRRQEAVVTICYEAQARLLDPVYGCVPTLFAEEDRMREQISALRKEVEMARMQLMNIRRTTYHQPQQDMGLRQQPDLSVFPSTNNSSGGSMNAGHYDSTISHKQQQQIGLPQRPDMRAFASNNDSTIYQQQQQMGLLQQLNRCIFPTYNSSASSSVNASNNNSAGGSMNARNYDSTIYHQQQQHIGLPQQPGLRAFESNNDSTIHQQQQQMGVLQQLNLRAFPTYNSSASSSMNASNNNSAGGSMHARNYDSTIYKQQQQQIGLPQQPYLRVFASNNDSTIYQQQQQMELLQQLNLCALPTYNSSPSSSMNANNNNSANSAGGGTNMTLPSNSYSKASYGYSGFEDETISHSGSFRGMNYGNESSMSANQPFEQPQWMAPSSRDGQFDGYEGRMVSNSGGFHRINYGSESLMSANQPFEQPQWMTPSSPDGQFDGYVGGMVSNSGGFHGINYGSESSMSANQPFDKPQCMAPSSPDAQFDGFEGGMVYNSGDFHGVNHGIESSMSANQPQRVASSSHDIPSDGSVDLRGSAALYYSIPHK